MQKREVITIPNPILKEKTEKVASFDSELKTQIEQMIQALKEHGGVGIAANQLGYNNNVIAIEFEDPDKKDHIPLSIFINPEIVDLSEEKACFEEGCLSVPKIEFEIERPKTLKLKYEDEHGHKLKIAPKGLLARILQHEIDHLNGVLFIEHARKQFLGANPDFKSINILFCGSGEFAAIILEGLIHLGLNLKVVTETSKPAGRDKEPKLTAVAKVAKKFAVECIETESIATDVLDVKQFDLIICADYGQKIPNSILKGPKIASINIHPSLLPEYRGPTPVQTAILDGKEKTGVSIIKMTDVIDQGPIYSQAETEILPNDDAFTLRDRLAALGLKLLVKTLPKIAEQSLELVAQDESKATFTRKITKEDGLINWKNSPKKIDQRIRAYHPWPAAYTLIDDKRLIIHQAHIKENKLVLDQVQLEGKAPMPFDQFLRGWRGNRPKWFDKVLT